MRESIVKLTGGGRPGGWLRPAPLALAVGWVVIAYGLAVLASLLLVAWLFAILLFDSWGVSAWVPTAGLVVVVAAIAWCISRTAGVIGVTVAAAIGFVWSISQAQFSDPLAALYASWAVFALCLWLGPNLAVKRYERWRVNRAARSARS